MSLLYAPQYPECLAWPNGFGTPSTNDMLMLLPGKSSVSPPLYTRRVARRWLLRYLNLVLTNKIVG